MFFFGFADLLVSKAHHITYHPASFHPSVLMSVCLSVCLLEVVAQIEVIGPKGSISDLWTPWMSAKRHTKF